MITYLNASAVTVLSSREEHDGDNSCAPALIAGSDADHALCGHPDARVYLTCSTLRSSAIPRPCEVGRVRTCDPRKVSQLQREERGEEDWKEGPPQDFAKWRASLTRLLPRPVAGLQSNSAKFASS